MKSEQTINKRDLPVKGSNIKKKKELYHVKCTQNIINQILDFDQGIDLKSQIIWLELRDILQWKKLIKTLIIQVLLFKIKLCLVERK